jgi:reactive intermediate/imine deaminase
MRSIISLVTLVVAGIAVGCEQQRSTPTETEFLASQEFEALGLPFSEAARVGNVLYLSGQIGNLPGTLELVEGGVSAETDQTMRNIASILERSGSGMDRVVKCTVFLADIEEWPAVNAVYRTFFDPPYPARSAVAGSGLALGARVEVECIATVG